MMTRHLFAYGTLMFPQVVEALTGRAYASLDAELRDFARYSVEMRGGRTFPAVVEQNGSSVHGKLVLNIGTTAITVFDHFERVDEGLYSKQYRTVVSGKRSYEALVYVAGPKLASRLNGLWDPAAFACVADDYAAAMTSTRSRR